MIYTIYLEFGGHVYQQTVGIQDFFLYPYEANFVQYIQKSNLKKTKTSFNHTVRYIYDVLSLNNPKFNDYIDVIYPEELEIKDTTDAPKWADYLDLHLVFDEDGSLHTRLYDTQDD